MSSTFLCSAAGGVGAARLQGGPIGFAVGPATVQANGLIPTPRRRPRNNRGQTTVSAYFRSWKRGLSPIVTLGLDPAKVNPLGGAIALGHPLGATGAIRAATVIAAMQRGEARTGMVTMCIGTGMGAAGIFERV